MPSGVTNFNLHQAPLSVTPRIVPRRRLGAKRVQVGAALILRLPAAADRNAHPEGHRAPSPELEMDNTGSSIALQLLDLLAANPFITVRKAEAQLGGLLVRGKDTGKEAVLCVRA